MGATSGPRGLYSIQSHSEDPWDGLLRGVGLFILLAFLAVWIGTEWTAYKLGFQAVLGSPIAPHIYAPWSGAEWAFRFHASQDPRVHAAFTQGTILDVIGLVAAFAVAAWFGRRAMLRSQAHSDLHGSAHWASEEEI